MITFSKKLVFVLSCIVVLNYSSLWGQSFTIPEKPDFQTSVYDGASLLSTEQKLVLEQKLIRYADSTSTQIVIITVKSLQGNDPSYTATQWAHKWGIGQADKDNGIILLVAAEDRKMTIQVGYGLEHLLTDAYSRRIIEQILAPHFRQQDYYGGFDEATNAMFQIFAGEYQNDAPADNIGFLPVLIFIAFVFLLIIFIAIAAKNSKNNGGNSPHDDDFFGPIILSRGGRSTWGGGFGGGSWGGGSSGGGGFGGGFGGGGFGGGGASGGW